MALALVHRPRVEAFLKLLCPLRACFSIWKMGVTIADPMTSLDFFFNLVFEWVLCTPGHSPSLFSPLGSQLCSPKTIPVTSFFSFLPCVLEWICCTYYLCRILGENARPKSNYEDASDKFKMRNIFSLVWNTTFFVAHVFWRARGCLWVLSHWPVRLRGSPNLPRHCDFPPACRSDPSSSSAVLAGFPSLLILPYLLFYRCSTVSLRPHNKLSIFTTNFLIFTYKLKHS